MVLQAAGAQSYGRARSTKWSRPRVGPSPHHRFAHQAPFSCFVAPGLPGMTVLWGFYCGHGHNARVVRGTLSLSPLPDAAPDCEESSTDMTTTTAPARHIRLTRGQRQTNPAMFPDILPLLGVHAAPPGSGRRVNTNDN